MVLKGEKYMEEKKKYLKPVIEDEEILIEDICLLSGGAGTDQVGAGTENVEEFPSV